MVKYKCERCGQMIATKSTMSDYITCDKCGYKNKNKMERWWEIIEIDIKGDRNERYKVLSQKEEL